MRASPLASSMAILIAIVVLAVLFFGFIALTAAEAKSGRRALRGVRARLDAHVASLKSVHAELPHVARKSFVSALSVLAHEVAHSLLIGIRAIERALTRATRSLREHSSAHKDVQ